MSAPTYVENGLLIGISDLSTFVPLFLSAFFVAFLSFLSFFFSSFFLPMLFVPCHLRYGRIPPSYSDRSKHSIFRTTAVPQLPADSSQSSYTTA
jgi:hypothetical protein